MCFISLLLSKDGTKVTQSFGLSWGRTDTKRGRWYRGTSDITGEGGTRERRERVVRGGRERRDTGEDGFPPKEVKPRNKQVVTVHHTINKEEFESLYNIK